MTTDTPMVERLAREIGAIYDGEVDPIATPNRYPVAELAARAVLECLRTPTPEMVEAAILRAEFVDADGWSDVEVATALFQYMIDAAIDRALLPSKGEGE